MSDDDLTWAVEASAAQIALMWTVHQWEPTKDAPSKPLDLQIIHFSVHALGEVCNAHPILRHATEEVQWLIYFKGLVAADTHPRDQMLSAIDAVRKRRAYPSTKSPVESAEKRDARQYEIDPTTHAEALAAIARVLGKASDNGLP
jgi:hypothetical protein